MQSLNWHVLLLPKKVLGTGKIRDIQRGSLHFCQPDTGCVFKIHARSGAKVAFHATPVAKVDLCTVLDVAFNNWPGQVGRAQHILRGVCSPYLIDIYFED